MKSSGATILSHLKFKMNKTNLKVKAQSSKFWDLGFGIWDFRASRGYTLIEMLISVTIFSGLLIIVLGTVASSSSSSAKVSLLRDKSQAARSLIDQISSDLRYVDLTANVNDSGDRGFLIDSTARTSLSMVLLLPGEDKDTGLIWKHYKIEVYNARRTLTLEEGRDCQRAAFVVFNDCDFKSDKTDLLSDSYTFAQETGYSSELGGLNVLEAEQQILPKPPISPFVSMVFTLKPTGQTGSCESNPGICYKVSTTINIPQND